MKLVQANKILVIDDRADVRLSLVILFEDAYLDNTSTALEQLTNTRFEVIEADNPQSAQVQLKQHKIDLILLDMNFSLDTTSGEEGLGFLRWLQQSKIDIPVIALTAWSNTDLVVKAMQLGAKDFVEKPWKNKQLLNAVQQQLSFEQLQQQNAKLQQLSQNQQQQSPKNSYQWRSPCMVQLFTQIETVAKTDVNILLTGDNGTGKSELAHFIHKQSLRHDNELVSVNMGAISESLFESEMFGHKKGAFTDAKSNRIGRFELAAGGTLFLDEIANIPLSQQAKLLRVLESGEFEVLGSSHTQTTDIRLISATNGDFSRLINDEKFREDLYYRLNTITFHVPALAQRQEDIIPLTQFYLAHFAHKYNLATKSLSDQAKQALLSYHWPGNIRELSHLVERAILLTQAQQINLDDLRLSPPQKNNAAFSTTAELPLMTLAQAEQQLINKALLQTDHHIPNAAKILGLSKSSMYRRLEKYDLVKS